MKSGTKAAPGTSPIEEIAPLANLEKRYLAWAAENFPGDRKSLAERLGISERTLYRKLSSTGH
jgi:DNA-binding NtrC family response regulator